MKISYIIAPSDSKEYLIRCMNSLYRQTSKNFEVILAENVFDDVTEDVTAYLEKHKDIKCISNRGTSFKEKLENAMSLVAADTEYVTFITMDTVAASVTAELVEKEAKGAEVFVPTVVLKEGQTASASGMTETTSIEDLRGLGFYRVFFGKNTLAELKGVFFEDEGAYELFKIKKMLGSEMVGSSTVGFYIDQKETVPAEKADILSSEKLLCLLRQAMESEKQELKISFLCYCLENYRDAANSRSTEEDKMQEVFDTLKEIGKVVKGDFVGEKLYELYVGCTADEMQCLNLASYRLYMEKVNVLSGTKTVAATVEIPQNDSLVLMQKQMVADLQELKMNFHYLRKTVASEEEATASGDLSYVTEVPKMFAQGKLGFSIILKSIKGWLSYKFKRGKK